MPTVDCAADAYEVARPTVEKTAGRFARKYRRDFEETLAEANYLFVRAFLSFRPGGNLDRRVRFLVWHGLMDLLRAEIRRHIPAAPLTPHDSIPDRRAYFDRAGFESGLSDDARALAELVLDPHPELDAEIRSSGCPGPWSERNCLVRHARRRWGWSPGRVRRAFAEIDEELSRA